MGLCRHLLARSGALAEQSLQGLEGGPRRGLQGGRKGTAVPRKLFSFALFLCFLARYDDLQRVEAFTRRKSGGHGSNSEDGSTERFPRLSPGLGSIRVWPSVGKLLSRLEWAQFLPVFRMRGLINKRLRPGFKLHLSTVRYSRVCLVWMFVQVPAWRPVISAAQAPGGKFCHSWRAQSAFSARASTA